MKPDLHNKPLIPQGWLRALIFCVVYFTLVYIAFLALGIFKKPAASNENNIATGVPYLSFIAIAIISIASVWLFRIILDHRSFNSIGFSLDKNGPHAGAGFFLGILLLCAGTCILFFSKNLAWTDINFNGNELFISFGLMVIIAFAEEIVFRGYILNNLLDSVNKWLALLATSLIFALAHVDNPGFSIVAAINIFLAGILLGVNYIYTRNLWFGILLHFTWNFFEGPILGYDVSGQPLQSLFQHEIQGSEWITGGRFGFEGSLVATPLCILAIAALIWVYQRKYILLPGRLPLQQTNGV
jgi:membrane protease YdiL (CAAX protease family)